MAPPSSPATDLVTVRYWAAARDAAGRETDTVPAGSVAQVLAAVCDLRPGDERFAQMVRGCSVLVDGRQAAHRSERQARVTPGMTVELLPPFAGG